MQATSTLRWIAFVLWFTTSSGLLLFFPPNYQLLENIAFTTMVPSVLSRDELAPSVNIPTAIRKLHPLPQEELFNAYGRANSYLISGEFVKALKEFNKALELAPENPDIYLSRGITNEKLENWRDAIDDYKQANSLYKKRPFSGDDATSFSNLGNAETGLGLWEDALQDYTYAAKLKSDFIAPQLGRNLVLYQLGRESESIAYFSALVARYPVFADGQAALAVMLFENGDLDKANEAWEVAVEQGIETSS